MYNRYKPVKYTIIFINKMAFEIDSSSIIASFTQELTRSTKGRGIASLVWVHSRIIFEGEDRDSAGHVMPHGPTEHYKTVPKN